MIESEDGTVTGSIDVSRLDAVEAKTDEAKAQLEQLKVDVQAGQEQVQADSEAQNAGAVSANPLVEEVPTDDRDPQGKSAGADADEVKPPQKATDAAAKKTAAPSGKSG